MTKPQRGKLTLESYATKKEPPRSRALKTAESTPARGNRGDFARITVTMPPEMLAELKILGARRQAQGEKNTDVCSLVREAVMGFLKGGVK